ncbi:uncharacterized protein C1orf21 homolog isoform X1 [Camelus ferus]|uniref:Uncharacterized protein C1orf21 homolog isoform X1 n=1 Tax=Camelus ferus TaxID=419612 RepID=A0A8B8RNB6_CAMFR|nr:uncharacterized protein C1orf21 homolog isoform X1 [Camelus ferus]
MGCASAKHVATVQNEEEAQKGKSYQNGDVFGDEYRIKPVEEVKYMKNGAEEEQKIAARNQENLEKSASSNVRLKTNKEIPGLVHQPRAKTESTLATKCTLSVKLQPLSSERPCCPRGCTSPCAVLAENEQTPRVLLAHVSPHPNINVTSASCTSLKANRNSSECWMKKSKRVEITVRKKRISHSAILPLKPGATTV